MEEVIEEEAGAESENNYEDGYELPISHHASSSRLRPHLLLTLTPLLGLGIIIFYF
jgi:hypothetical protein